MGSIKTIMGAGLSGLAARSVGAGTTATGLTAAGSTNADALQLVADSNLVTTTGSGTGVLLPNAEDRSVVYVGNGGSNALKIYPPASGQLNNQTATTGSITVGAGKGAVCVRLDNIHWIVCADAA